MRVGRADLGVEESDAGAADVKPKGTGDTLQTLALQKERQVSPPQERLRGDRSFCVLMSDHRTHAFKRFLLECNAQREKYIGGECTDTF